MIDELEAILHSQATRSEKLLGILYAIDSPTAPAAIKLFAARHGLAGVKRWNISTILGRTDGLAISTPEGWRLTKAGISHVETLGLQRSSPQVANALGSLRGSIAGLSPETVNFLREAVTCLETGCYRAAVIMSWVAAIHILQSHVVQSYLASFNAEASRRDKNWRNAKDEDDLSLLGENEFLDICSKVGAIQKNIKAELKICLDRRNGCGHPNSYQVSELTACHHVETLVDNVYSKF